MIVDISNLISGLDIASPSLRTTSVPERVKVGFRVSAFYSSSHLHCANAHIPAGPHLLIPIVHEPLVPETPEFRTLDSRAPTLKLALTLIAGVAGGV